MTDRGGILLDELLAEGAMDVEQALDLGIALTTFVASVHARGAVVGRWPTGVLVQREAGGVVCSPTSDPPVPRARQALQDAPPEQLVTSKAVHDVAGDLYHVGLTLYRALVGRYPFDLEGPELLHAHLARNPVPPHEADPRVPWQVSLVVAKLLARSPSARHGSARSVLADLHRCQQLLAGALTEGAFEPGVLDLGTRIDALPLLGRDEPLARLSKVWEQVRGGGTHAAVVTGPAGIGKSALIRAFRKRIGRGARFASGKFDPVHRGLASSALVAVIQAIVRELLSEDANSFEASRTKLTASLGRSAGVLVQLVPELAHLVGQDEAPSMPPVETKNRLEHAFVQLIGAVASWRPLVLFVDDLQWCDEGSARLLGILLDRVRDGSLLVLAAHRPIEDASHPANGLLTEWRAKESSTLSEIVLDGLDVCAVETAIDQVLRAPAEHGALMAEILTRTSGGNPFHLQSLLHRVHDAGLLQFEPPRWVVDVEALQALNVTDDVADLVVDRFSELSEGDRRLCQVAACLGCVFDLDVLSELVGEDPDAAREGLRRLCDARLIAVADMGPGPGQPRRYRFQHDRVHQTVYATMCLEEAAHHHAGAGKLLLARLEERDAGADIFLVVDHLNRGASADFENGMTVRRRLNLRAAERALHSTAYGSAVLYAEKAAEGFDDSSWSGDPDFALALALARATAYHLTGASARAEQCLKRALEREHRVLQRSQLHTAYLTVLMVASRYVEALEHARKALGELNLSLDADEVAIPSLDATVIGGLVHAEEMRRPRALAGARILGAMLPLTFLGDPSLFQSVVRRSVRLTLDEGPAAESAIAVAAHGILLTTTGEYGAAFDCGHSAIALGQRFGDLSQRCRAQEIFIACLGHWVAPLRDSEPIADDAFRAGVDCGDLQYAAYTRLYDVVNRFHAGHSLATLKSFCEELTELPKRIGDQVTGHVIAGTLRVLEALIDGHSGPLDDDDAFLTSCHERGAALSAFLYLVMKAEALLHLGRIDACERALEQAEPLIPLAPGVFGGAVFVFLRAMVSARRAEGAAPEERGKRLSRAAEDLETLARWAERSPVNFLHKVELVQAECRRQQSAPLEAMRAYEDARRLSAQAGYQQDELLAVTRCEDLCQELGLHAQAEAFGARAAGLREAWVAGGAGSFGFARPGSVAREFSHASPVTLLGFTAAMQATQEIAQSLELAEVLHRFVSTAMIHSGAERATLVLQDDGERQVAETQPAWAGDGPPSVVDLVPLQVLRFVERTGRTVEVHSGRVSPLFDFDPYLLEHAPASLIAVPLLQRGVVVGVLCLESRSSDRVFSGGTRHFLEVLAARAVSALENARLFASVAREVEQRRATERQLTAYLEEKNTLLREVHHRVGNNLQVVSSLLSLQMDRAGDEVARQVLMASRERIRAMALVHQQLHGGGLGATVDIRRYLRDLSQQVLRTHDSRVQLDFDLCELQIGVAQAVPLGLVLNELLSNSLRHAFPRGEGNVRICLRMLGVGRAELVVADDGIGMTTPSSDRAHLGLKICEALAAQLDGRILSEANRGTVFRMDFETRVPEFV